MNEATPSKISRVNILSDIVINPIRSPPQNVIYVPPLSSVNNKGRPEIINTENVSVLSIATSNSTTDQIPNTDFATIQATEESLKRKSAGIFACHKTPKKPKLEALNDQNKKKGGVDSSSEETFFNYMTGTYERVTKIELPMKAVSPEDNTHIREEDIKDELTIHETSLQAEELIAAKEETKDIKSEVVRTEDLKEGIKSVVQNGKLDLDKKPTLTIDLTDDDDTEPNINVQNNIFIQNVLALQNAITLQSLLKSKSNSKVPLQNVVLQSPGNLLTNLTSNVVMKSPSSILSNSPSTQNNSSVRQPLVLMVHNNSPFLVPQNMVSGKTTNNNNNNNGLSPNLVLLPNNFNFQTNVVVANNSNITNLSSHSNQSPVKSVVDCPQTTRQKNCLIAPKNTGGNLVPTTFANISSTTKTSGSVQPSRILVAQSGAKLDEASQSSLKFNSPIKSTSSVENIVSSPKHQPTSSHTFAQTLTQNFTCQTCPHKARSKRDLILHIYHSHLKGIYELSLRCKVCNFDTDNQSVMEKHDLEHGGGSKNEQDVDNIHLSSNVEIRIRVDKKRNDIVNQNVPCNAPVIDISDSDEEITKKKSVPVEIFRCFDCNFLCSKRRSLQNHAVRHAQSKFQCPKHVNSLEGCEECDYKKCLSDLEKTMFVCRKCGYRTCRRQCFDAHLCDKGKVLFSSDSDSEGGLKLTTFKCFHCSHVTNSLDMLKYHAIQHYGGAFACDLHQPQKSMFCDKCLYEMILKDLQHVVHLCDCGFRTLDKKIYSTHKAKIENCQDFRKRAESGLSLNNYFESSTKVSALHAKLPDGAAESNINKILPVKVSSRRNVSRNSGGGKCRVRFVRKKAEEEEEISSDTEIEEDYGNFKCFHCTYITTSRVLLECHAVKHCDQAFECDLHPLATSSTSCKKCLYKSMQEELKEKVLLCQHCGFRTLRQPTFSRHASNPRNCEMYLKKLVNEAVEHSENESDPEIRNSSKKRKKKCTSSLIICAKCNYRAMDGEIFKLHEKWHENNKGEKKQTLETNTLLNCFDCNDFCTKDRETLKEHSIRHYKKNFSCDKHLPKYTAADCGKCIYLSIKKDMESEILICNQCSFKTLRIDVYEQHKSLNSCSDHKETLTDKDDDDDDYVPDDDVGGGKGSYVTNSGTVTSNETVHNCMDCSSRCVNQCELEKHIVESHQDSTFKCNVHSDFKELCKKCLYQYVLEKTSENKMLSCTICGFKCHTIDKMRSHLECNVHCDGFSKILYSPMSGDEAAGEMCTCYDCGQEFDSRQELWSHASRHRSEFHCSYHTGSSQKDCGKCLYAFILKSIALYYFRCFDCSDQIFACELDLKDHVDKKHRDSSFKCDVHLSIPGKDCQLCQYAYIVAQKYTKMTYFCTDCRASEFPFANWNYLTTHVGYKHKNSATRCSLHNNNKPYLECNKCFYEKVLMYVRFKGNDVGYKCCECPLKVCTREQLEAHVRLVHESSAFQCTTHSLGDIDEKCSMCEYESMVVINS